MIKKADTACGDKSSIHYKQDVCLGIIYESNYICESKYIYIIQANKVIICVALN